MSMQDVPANFDETRDEIASGKHDDIISSAWAKGADTDLISRIVFLSKKFEPIVYSRLHVIRDASPASLPRAS